jgi:glycosyltransferase involved in cell wall biosynthesis
MSERDVDGWRLALDVGPLHRQPAGVGIYVSGLAAGLSRLMPDRLALIGVRPNAALPPVAAGVPAIAFNSPNYHAWLQLRADRDARSTSANVVHYTNAAAPLTARVPFVLTVHDLSVLRLPRLHPKARLATVPVTLTAIARARAIIVPSRWTRREVVRGLRVSPRRVTVIEHAARNAADATGSDGDSEQATLDRYSLQGGRFLLSVGTIEPRKNIPRLLKAFEHVVESDPTLRLVLVGADGWHSAPIKRQISASHLSDRITLTGHIEEAQLRHLMHSCAALAYVSIYEGYGIPIIEAMAVGAPVVASRTTAMPEAAGGAAVLVDPLDPSDIARGLHEAIQHRDELGAAGRVRASGRTWTTVAAEHIEVYRWAATR